MTPSPYETTLTMQSYVQMREATDLGFLDVFTPSTCLERKLGYDMKIRNLKGVVFQYKRPKLSKDGDRRFRIRYSGQDPPQLAIVKTYAAKYGDDIAYYAFPLIAEHDALGNTLAKTAFVKATAIPHHALVIYVSGGYCQQGRRRSREPLEVHCSRPTNTNDSWTNSIDSTAVFGWEALYEGIENCRIGFKIRYHGESCAERYQARGDRDYFPQTDEDYWETYSQDELFGLTGESGPLMTRLGSNDDEVFG